MNIDIMIQIAKSALKIGASDKHFVSIDLSMHEGAFPVCVYIHKLNNLGISDGIEDSMDFSTDDSYILHKGWFEKWAERIAKEREIDETS